jgi:hypothetical protein
MMIVNILLNRRSDYYVMKQETGNRHIMLLLWPLHYESEANGCSAGGTFLEDTLRPSCWVDDYRGIPDIGFLGPMEVRNLTLRL